MAKMNWEIGNTIMRCGSYIIRQRDDGGFQVECPADVIVARGAVLAEAIEKAQEHRDRNDWCDAGEDWGGGYQGGANHPGPSTMGV
jgi:hypothetical protein